MRLRAVVAASILVTVLVLRVPDSRLPVAILVAVALVLLAAEGMSGGASDHWDASGAQGRTAADRRADVTHERFR